MAGFAFSPPKSYGTSHPAPAAKVGDLPSKPANIPTPLDTTQPETIGLPPQIPKG